MCKIIDLFTKKKLFFTNRIDCIVIEKAVVEGLAFELFVYSPNGAELLYTNDRKLWESVKVNECYSVAYSLRGNNIIFLNPSNDEIMQKRLVKLYKGNISFL